MRSSLKSNLKAPVISFIFILLLVEVSQAHRNPGYAHDKGVQTSNPRWMTAIRDDVLISELSLPGTHDTMSFYGGDIVQTQTMSLPDQLESGIRVLDIRCRHIRHRFPIYHGAIFQEAYFEDVLKMVYDFLQKNPRETVLMRVKEESTPVGNTRTFEETFRQLYWNVNKELFWQGTSDNPKLGEVRGRLVVLQDFRPARHKHGIDYRSFDIQDEYKLGTNWDLWNKWRFVWGYLNKANAPGNKDTKYMNYLSGSGGSFPYFVASGHSSPGTAAPRLATGHTNITLPRGWPDFPRVDCARIPPLIGPRICTVAFEGTNDLTYERLGTHYKNRVGTIMSDFPGPGLIKRTIDLNNRFKNFKKK